MSISIKAADVVDNKDFESYLRPKRSSVAGFLASDDSIKEVLEHDQAILDRHEITYTQIGEKLLSIILKIITLREANPSVSYFSDYDYFVEGKFKVRVQNYCGSQSCPFAEFFKTKCTHLFGSLDLEIKNLETKEILEFAGMHGHLAKEHNFCESPKSKYRLDIEKAIRVLKLEKEVDYTPHYTDLSSWKIFSRFQFSSLSDPARQKEFERSLSLEKKENLIFSSEKEGIVIFKDSNLNVFLKSSGEDLDALRPGLEIALEGLPQASKLLSMVYSRAERICSKEEPKVFDCLIYYFSEVTGAEINRVDRMDVKDYDIDFIPVGFRL